LKELEGTAERLNSELEGTGYSVRVGQRYGYKALDLYRNGKMQRTLRTGLTTGEAQEYLFAMMKGMELSRHKKKLDTVV
ncbi:hypothetical protein KY333_05865, partial [Candidatus Woesearchaeota archaeon]|nr:hypothetical protein [Candidatus Woesearchaeota archaeon]